MSSPEIDVETLKIVAADSKSKKEVLEKLGLPPTTRNYVRLNKVAEEAQVLLQEFGQPTRSLKKRGPYVGSKASKVWNEQNFREAVENSTSIKEIAVRLGIPVSGGTYSAIRAAAERYGVEIIAGQEPTEKRKEKRQASFDRTLVKRNDGVRVEGKVLKNLLLEFGICEEKCFDCGLETMYNGKPLVLQIDHSNGDATDNRVENLKILCPNCHSQTDTFGNRNRGKGMTRRFGRTDPAYLREKK